MSKQEHRFSVCRDGRTVRSSGIKTNGIATVSVYMTNDNDYTRPCRLVLSEEETNALIASLGNRLATIAEWRRKDELSRENA